MGERQMKPGNWLLLVIFSALGYAATFLFFPKVMPAAHWGLALDRNAAISKAKALADSFGAEKTDWIALIETSYDRQNEYYAATQPLGLGSGYISALKTQVT